MYLCSLSVLLDVCQFYWTFQRIKSLVSLIFSIVFLFSIPLILKIFIIFFLLFSLDLFCSSFPRFLRWELRLLIWDFSFFLMYMFSAINFHLSTALAASYKFWYFLLSFSFISMYSWPLNNTDWNCVVPFMHKFFFNCKCNSTTGSTVCWICGCGTEIWRNHVYRGPTISYMWIFDYTESQCP